MGMITDGTKRVHNRTVDARTPNGQGTAQLKS